MKLTSIFLVALLALSVFANPKEATKSASTHDDWNEKTDIQHREKSSSRSWRTEDPSYKLHANESFVGKEREVTDGKAAVWKNVTEHVLRIINGSIVNTTETRRVKVDTHRKIQRIRTILHTKHRITNVILVVKSFAAAYGKALSPVEFKQINTIITTDDNDFKMDYEIKQIRKANLDVTIRQLAKKMFTVSITEADFAHWENLIVKNCSNHYQVMALDTSSVEVHRPDLWTVKTEVLMATCGDASSPGYQLFAWAASKSGAYHKGQYSVSNSIVVDQLITRWLYSNMAAMVDCKAASAGSK